ncbi:MAG TPA: EamA family transporter, partial [Candidatus Dormibacteraeota bacterium]|nr:EamA family transporter [Candidatus Dormibacteraeota bacterium]
MAEAPERSASGSPLPGLGRLPAPSSLRALGSVPPEALLVTAGLSVQIGASLATDLLRTHPAIEVVALRLVFGAALLLLLRRPSLALARPGAWRSAAVLGVIFVAMNTSFYLAISRIPLGVAVTLEFWGPLAVAVFGSRRLRDLVWVALAALGIYLLAGGRIVADDLLGVAGALAAGLFWLTFILIGPRIGRDWPDGRGLAVALVFGSGLAVPLALVTGWLGGGGLAGGGLAAGLDLGLLGTGLVIAGFSSALPWSLELAAMRR